MKKVIIKNALDLPRSEASFSTDLEMQAWIDDNVSNDSWGVVGSYSIEIIDITEENDLQLLITKALQDQNKGKTILATVHALNAKKFKAGLLDQNAFLAMLDNPELKYIERLLLNGSLDTAKHFMNQLDETYFSKEEKAAIIELF